MAAETDVQTFAELASAIPEYDSFLTVDELRQRDEHLAAEYDHVEFDVVGESADGTEMWTLTLGEGDDTALMFAAPHPNEPIGCLTLDFLAHELADNASLRDAFDCQFVLMKAADPDGLQLNEGWFDGPFTLSNYAQNYYRPSTEEQVEWAFPFEHDDYAFGDPVPETEVLMDVIDTHEPGFIFSLHNAGFGGAYFFLSEPLPGLHETLQQIPGEHDIPLHLGEPEVPTVEEFDDVIYQLPTAMKMLKTYEEHGDRDPEELAPGANSYDYAQQVTDAPVVELLVELPYFSEPRITDQTELDESRESVLVDAYTDLIEFAEMLRDEYEAIEDLLPDSRLKRAAGSLCVQGAGMLESQLEWARSAEETNQPATVAQRMDAEYVMQFYFLPVLGMLLRVIDKAAMQADGEDYTALVETRRKLEREFHERMGTLVEELDYEPIPIQDLVAVQARAGLATLAHVQDRT